MKANILVALSIIILVASSLASSTVYAQPPTVTVTRLYWGSTANLVQAVPGDINIPLNIIIQNYGTTEWDQITSLNAQLLLHNLPFTDSATGGYYSTAGYSDTLKSGQSTTLTFYLNIAPDADIKTYEVPLTLEVTTPKYQTALEVPLTVNVPLLGKAAFSLDAAPVSLPSGNSQLDITLRNSGTGSASSVQVSLSIPTPLTLTGQSNVYTIDSLPSKANFTFPVLLYIPSSSAGSAYSITADITYNDPYGNTRSETYLAGFSVEQSSKPNIVLSPHGTSLTSGSENTVVLEIINEGDSDVYSLDVSVTTPTDFILLGSDNNWHFDQVKSKGSVTVNMTVATDSGISGTYSLTITLNYKNQVGDTFTETRTLGLLVSLAVNEWQSPLAIYTSTDSLTAGYTNKPTITISNSGESPVTSVNVLISAKESSTTSSTTTSTTTTTSNALIVTPGTERWLFESIKPNSNVTMTPAIFASQDYVDTSQAITLSISYLDSSGNLHTESRSIGFIVKGAIIIAIQEEQVSPATISAGEEFTITGNLLNKGNTTALYSAISLKPNPNFVSSSGSQYMGDITVNTPIPFSLPVTAQKNVGEGTYPVTAVLTYEDGYGETYSKEITVQVSISKPTATPAPTQETILGSSALFRILFIAALVAIAGGGSIAIFKAYRGRKRTLEA